MADTDNTPSDDVLLHLDRKSDAELRSVLDQMYAEEQKVSYRRRVLHGKIDILRAELVRRLKGRHDAGDGVISGADVDRLVEILSNDLRGVSRYDVAVDDVDELDDEDM